MPTSRPLPVLCPERIRKMPTSFAWIDHRLRSNGWLQMMTGDEVDLYVFLTLASDKQLIEYKPLYRSGIDGSY